MSNRIYLIDLDIELSNIAFADFFTLFLASNTVALVSERSIDAIPTRWAELARYVFASDGHEFYSNKQLRYKHSIVLSKEAYSWIASKQLSYIQTPHKILFDTDKLTSVKLVAEFNELFSEFTAQLTSSGFYISDLVNLRKHIVHLINTDYDLIFISDIRNIGTVNFELAAEVLQRGSVYTANNSEQLMQLLTDLQQN
jgi:hypothetical protein